MFINLLLEKNTVIRDKSINKTQYTLFNEKKVLKINIKFTLIFSKNDKITIQINTFIQTDLFDHSDG